MSLTAHSRDIRYQCRGLWRFAFTALCDISQKAKHPSGLKHVLHGTAILYLAREALAPGQQFAPEKRGDLEFSSVCFSSIFLVILRQSESALHLFLSNSHSFLTGRLLDPLFEDVFLGSDSTIQKPTLILRTSAMHPSGSLTHFYPTHFYSTASLFRLKTCCCSTMCSLLPLHFEATSYRPDKVLND